MQIVNFLPDHLNDIIAIEKSSFPKPWTKEMFLGSAGNKLVSFIVAVEENKVIGYCLFSIICETAEILNIAVSPDFRGGGFAKQMLEYVIDKIKNNGVKNILLDVRVSNTAAKQLYAKFGFQAFGVRKNYYGNEDGLALRKIL